MTRKDQDYQGDSRATSENSAAVVASDAIQTVAVQGLGFVGAATAVAAAGALNDHGQPYFDVIGVDLPTPSGQARVAKVNSGSFPFETVDQKILAGIEQAVRRGNLAATTDSEAFKQADVILVNVNLDLSTAKGMPTVDMDAFRGAMSTLGKNVKEGALIIVETTVPPGTCERIVEPIVSEQARARGMDPDAILIAHSYERVMPGAHYLDSITNFWRVYAGLTLRAAEACEAFFSKIINVEEYPLTRLGSTTASEIGKVLENSYRATNIAFIEEWARFAEAVGVDLYEVIDAIRVRPTHSNIRQPGFGVGGYCLTKDPLFAEIAAREIYGLSNITFPFSSQAVETNRAMPLVTLEKLKAYYGGSITGKRILLMGISYRQDVGDTRYSPSETFYVEADKQGAQITAHDPLVEYWEERNLSVCRELPALEAFDAIVLAVPHQEYQAIDMGQWLDKNAGILVFDANNVLTEKQRSAVGSTGNTLLSIGRG